MIFFFFSSRRRHTRWTGDWSSDVCSSDLVLQEPKDRKQEERHRQRVLALGDPRDGLHVDRVHGKKDRREPRSEERRVGKECRARWPPNPSKKNTTGR